ncbi:hypothetical protein DICPUDRAFT_81152 [Dictyostelium purpureum]|uniref:Uncharacterized protein n=1 Tax=Dictyostelium purpureum TaxID=5786 RepID=F0ZSN0_DICPU|nr:uncharacterized protein DICPUDRAFT_81152 [Dictyostelium purpureum]EGC33046.1 hypothetical protein DICPUDRAFT_81152 [Dictyostelium purpureum]|eukprot:XP_003290435.1 hypothetical protein DICPUDRAFT_81152 [Dictyostelium purpureum]
MTVLPDYLYSQILNEIVLHIYNNKLKEFYFSSSGWKFNNTEILGYCICKKWFNILSNLLLEHLSFNNYKLIKYLIKDNSNNTDTYIDNNIENNSIDNSNYNYNNKNNININNNNSNNQNYKLIQNNNKIKVYKSLKEYEIDNSKQYSKVLVIINNEEDSIIVLENIKNYPDNCQFNLILTSQELIEREFPAITNTIGGDIINNIKFIYIYFTDIEHTRNLNLWNKFSKLNPKEVVAFSIGTSDFSHLLKIQSIQSLMMPSLDILIDFSKLDNSSTSIKKLSLSLKDYWCSIVKTLSNNSTIKELILTNKCNVTLDESKYSNGCSIIKNSCSGGGDSSSSDKDYDGADVSHSSDEDDGYGIDSSQLDLSLINKGFETIFTSAVSSIESLCIHYFNFIDSSFLSSLSRNTTIKNLILKYTEVEPFFKQVLHINKTIRNLVVEYTDTDNEELESLFNLLKQYSINLYSVSVIGHYSNDHQECLEIVKRNQISLLNIKEFNIFDIKQSSNNYQFLKLNNTIGSIITYQSKNV